MSRVLIVGGGIVGCAMAAELSADGHEVRLVADGGIGSGATAAGMGHLVALDHEKAKGSLTDLSLQLWRKTDLPGDCEWDPCGTLWAARDDEELAHARAMQQRFAARGISCDLLAGPDLAELEPELAPGLVGGLLVASDVVIYPPNAARSLWHRAALRGAQRIPGTVRAVTSHRVELDDDRTLEADWIVVAAGDRTTELLPEVGIRPRKGHLLITTRGPRRLRHQVVELGYAATTEARDPVAVACNVQPRTTGQILVGSSRQEGTHDPVVEPSVLRRMLARAAEYFPRLPEWTALRAWTGFRAATDDGAPVIGILRPGLAVAGGHEGLGITQAPGTARLLAELLAGRDTSTDPTPYDPLRFQGAV